MRIIAASFMLAMLSFTMACPTSKPVAPVGDASADAAPLDEAKLGSKCHRAMLHLSELECAEGWQHPDAGDNYEQLCTKTERSHTFDVHPDCILSAKTQDEVTAKCNVVCISK